MSESAERILDAAEDRIRSVGFHGFSFRDLAGDVGVKSASVHYHFPTKADLGARVARRYTDRFMSALPDARAGKQEAALAAYRDAFRRALVEHGKMCLCGMLAAEQEGLPEPVQVEVRRFIKQNVEWLAALVGEELAWQHFSTLEGALITARASGDPEAFEKATRSMG